jgi:hypothetical protein
MTDSKDAWQRSTAGSPSSAGSWPSVIGKAGETQGAPPPDQARRSLDEAFSIVTRQLDVAFSSVGDTIRDPRPRRR